MLGLISCGFQEKMMAEELSLRQLMEAVFTTLCDEDGVIEIELPPNAEVAATGHYKHRHWYSKAILLTRGQGQAVVLGFFPTDCFSCDITAVICGIGGKPTEIIDEVLDEIDRGDEDLLRRSFTITLKNDESVHVSTDPLGESVGDRIAPMFKQYYARGADIERRYQHIDGRPIVRSRSKYNSDFAPAMHDLILETLFPE